MAIKGPFLSASIPHGTLQIADVSIISIRPRLMRWSSYKIGIKINFVFICIYTWYILHTIFNISNHITIG
jgi:hypothetical protein